MRVLDESKLPGLHTDVQHDAKKVLSALNGSRRNRNTEQIARIDASIRAMRDSIATQVAPP